MKVLLIDDDQDLLTIFSTALTKEGFEAVLAATGTEGLDKAKTEKPDIILLDQVLPDISGNDVLKTLKTGVTEIAIAEFVINRFMKHGASILSFTPIVSFGKNTANVHHEPSKTKLKKGDMIMLDFGCTLNHFCSDMTRTYFWGEPSERQKRIYLTVLRAQELALNKIKKGERRTWIIDKVARNFLNKKYLAIDVATKLGLM